MATFLKENWLWIVVPALLVFGGVLLLVQLGGDSTGSEFIYDV
ncbi:MAG: hypothetical protein AAF368_04545 [Planctomycetota bacterium]